MPNAIARPQQTQSVLVEASDCLHLACDNFKSLRLLFDCVSSADDMMHVEHLADLGRFLAYDSAEAQISENQRLSAAITKAGEATGQAFADTLNIAACTVAHFRQMGAVFAAIRTECETRTSRGSDLHEQEIFEENIDRLTSLSRYLLDVAVNPPLEEVKRLFALEKQQRGGER